MSEDIERQKEHSSDIRNCPDCGYMLVKSVCEHCGSGGLTDSPVRDGSSSLNSKYYCSRGPCCECDQNPCEIRQEAYRPCALARGR